MSFISKPSTLSVVKSPEIPSSRLALPSIDGKSSPRLPVVSPTASGKHSDSSGTPAALAQLLGGSPRRGRRKSEGRTTEKTDLPEAGNGWPPCRTKPRFRIGRLDRWSSPKWPYFKNFGIGETYYDTPRRYVQLYGMYTNKVYRLSHIYGTPLCNLALQVSDERSPVAAVKELQKHRERRRTGCNRETMTLVTCPWYPAKLFQTKISYLGDVRDDTWLSGTSFLLEWLCGGWLSHIGMLLPCSWIGFAQHVGQWIPLEFLVFPLRSSEWSDGFFWAMPSDCVFHRPLSETRCLPGVVSPLTLMMVSLMPPLHLHRFQLKCREDRWKAWLWMMKQLQAPWSIMFLGQVLDIWVLPKLDVRTPVFLGCMKETVLTLLVTCTEWRSQLFWPVYIMLYKPTFPAQHFRLLVLWPAISGNFQVKKKKARSVASCSAADLAKSREGKDAKAEKDKAEKAREKGEKGEKSTRHLASDGDWSHQVVGWNRTLEGLKIF